MAENVRAHVNISGRVQGVFYRAETQQAAQRRGVKGWVRNKSDGSVEAVFEGGKDRVEDMIKWCHQGSPGAVVERVDLNWEAYTGEFSGFEITY